MSDYLTEYFKTTQNELIGDENNKGKGGQIVNKGGAPKKKKKGKGNGKPNEKGSGKGQPNEKGSGKGQPNEKGSGKGQPNQKGKGKGKGNGKPPIQTYTHKLSPDQYNYFTKDQNFDKLKNLFPPNAVNLVVQSGVNVIVVFKQNKSQFMYEINKINLKLANANKVCPPTEWKCSVCNTCNYLSKSACRQCGTVRPSNISGTSGVSGNVVAPQIKDKHINLKKEYKDRKLSNVTEAVQIINSQVKNELSTDFKYVESYGLGGEAQFLFDQKYKNLLPEEKNVYYNIYITMYK